MKPINCILSCCSNVIHLSHLYTGFGLLETRGLITAKFLKNKEYKSNGKQLLVVSVNDSYHLAYDTADHARVYDDALSKCDLYFKRSYDQNTHEKLSNKILPLGLNYPVYGENDRAEVRALWAFRETGFSSTYDKLAKLVHSNSILSTIFRAKNSGKRLFGIKSFEGLPKYDRRPSIVFFVRAWDPKAQGIHSEEQAEERASINLMRAECIRKLRKEFGPSFIGGFQADDLSLKNFKDCVVDPSLTQKDHYLQTVRQSSIGVSTMGLDRSNGWKLAEYVANAKAIVSETLHYQVTGDFSAGKNYFDFETSDGCVEAAARLFNNPDECYRMMCENFSYYHQYLRPDMLVWNTLQKLTSLWY